MRTWLKQYASNVLTWMSQTLNTLLMGDPDETLSSRMGKRLDTCRTCRWVCALLNLIDKNHCRDAVEPDEGKDDVNYKESDHG